VYERAGDAGTIYDGLVVIGGDMDCEGYGLEVNGCDNDIVSNVDVLEVITGILTDGTIDSFD